MERYALYQTWKEKKGLVRDRVSFITATTYSRAQAVERIKNAAPFSQGKFRGLRVPKNFQGKRWLEAVSNPTGRNMTDYADRWTSKVYIVLQDSGDGHLDELIGTFKSQKDARLASGIHSRLAFAITRNVEPIYFQEAPLGEDKSEDIWGLDE